MTIICAWSTAAEIALAVTAGETTALSVIDHTLARIATANASLNAFTSVLGERARTTAEALDARHARGEPMPALAGVPFAVKNLFDVAGIATLAGSKINRDMAPARRDAALVRRLEAQGGILVGALNMGEYAYDFVGDNAHDGPSRNPHDPTRITGGSSGGSGAAVAGGLVPLALGSDTNGSIRVPASLCGIFGLKPTFGRLSRAGTFPFVSSLDHVGPLARTVRDLALAYDVLQGHDGDDPACAVRAAEMASARLDVKPKTLRIAKLGGYFHKGAEPDVLAAVHHVARALGATREIAIEETQRARAAAYVITATEAAALHLDRLRERAHDFDPAVRDRLLAGALVPQPFIAAAQKFRAWFVAEVCKLFHDVDVLLAPATPCAAPSIGQKTFLIDGVEMPIRPNLGIFTQPISFIGLPVVSVPVFAGRLPVGVQVIAAPWREDVALAVAHALEQDGVTVARQPGLMS